MSSPFAAYVFINTRLNMGKGKVAAQCMHAMRIAYGDLHNHSRETKEIWDAWESTGAKTITLKAENENEMLMLLENFQGVDVIDAGCTQVPPDSFTVCMLFPMKARDGGFSYNGKKYKLY